MQLSSAKFLILLAFKAMNSAAEMLFFLLICVLFFSMTNLSV